MDIQDLGAIGELIGGIAVIASVIYLAIQIRHGISGYQSHAVIEEVDDIATAFKVEPTPSAAGESS